MKKKIIVVLIVVGMILFYLYYFGHFDRWLSEDDGSVYYKGVTQDDISGNVNVAVIHLSYRVSPSPSVMDGMRYATETDTSNFPSVTTFYEKYNIHMTWSYYEHQVSELMQPSTMPRCDPNTAWNAVNTLGCHRDSLIYSWLMTASNSESVFDSNEILIFVIESDVNVMTDAGGYVAINAGSNAIGMFNSGLTYWLRYVIAHEIGHQFGAGTDPICGEHYFEPCKSDPDEANCIMNGGGGWIDEDGDVKSALTHNTNFAKRDLENELHFDYLNKYIRI